MNRGYDLEILKRERDGYNRSMRDPINGYDCPICHNKQSIMILQGEYNVLTPCECQSIHNQDININRSGLLQIYKTYHLGNFNTNTKNAKHMKEMALKYLSEKEVKWFYVGGQVGSGKTHIATAVLQELMRTGTPGLYKRWHEIVKELKAVMNTPEYNQVMNDLKTTKMLYIDDFLKNPTESDYNIAFEIIQGRADRQLRTIITSELYLTEIKDEAVSSRIREHCKEYLIHIVRGQDKNYRLNQFNM